MTFEEILRSDKVLLTAAEVGQALGISPQRIADQAREDPLRLGFPVIVAGNTVRIPRKPFIDWLTGRADSEEASEKKVREGREDERNAKENTDEC